MRIAYASAAAIPAGAWRWPHIDPAREWADRMSGAIVIETDFLDRFERLRAACGFPLPISSGYRTPEHNLVVATTGERGPHTTARAADLVLDGSRAYTAIGVAMGLGFTGIGVSQAAGASRFIHLDDLVGPAYPRPMIWSY